MVYTLTCGSCLLDSYVKSDVFTSVDWACSSCENVNSSSLPTEDEALITDHTKTRSLLSAEEAESVKDIIDGRDAKEIKQQKVEDIQVIEVEEVKADES